MFQAPSFQLWIKTLLLWTYLSACGQSFVTVVNDLPWHDFGSLKITLKICWKKVRSSRSCFKFIGAEGILLSLGFKRTVAAYQTNANALFSSRSVDVQFGSCITKVSMFRINRSSENVRVKIDLSNCSNLATKKALEGDKLRPWLMPTNLHKQSSLL